MITNFETHTPSLTEDEMKLNPIIIECLSVCTKPHYSDEVIDLIKQLYWKRTDDSLELSGAKLRKHINYIRSKGLLPVIATSKGYYVTQDKIEIQKQINSSFERASAIIASAEGLKKFL